MPQASGLQFTARIGGLPRDFFTVVGFELTESLSRLSVGRLDLASTFSDIAAADVLEQPVDLVVWQDGEPQWRLGLMHNSQADKLDNQREHYQHYDYPGRGRDSL